MDEHERYVREKWERVEAYDHLEDRPSIVNIYGIRPTGRQFCHYLLCDSWAAAKAFTVEHERQIAEVKEEIKEISHAITEWKDDGDDDTYQSLVYKRILSLRLQPVLDSLKQGMKQ